MTKAIINEQAVDYLSRDCVRTLEGFKTVEVTPRIAERWLKWNVENRSMRDGHVMQLADRMHKGEWMLNGQVISFSKDARLLDGQHRLSAVVEYGKPVFFDVRFGLEDETFKVIDDGLKRNPGDILEISGIQYPKAAAATAKLIILHERGFKAGGVNNRNAPSNLEILKFYNDNPIIGDCVKNGQHWYGTSNKIITLSQFAMFYFFMRKKDEQKAKQFLQSLADGVGLKATSPVLHLRKRLLAFKMDKFTTVKKSVKVGLVIKAWNLFVVGKEVKGLSYTAKDVDIELI